MKKPDLTRWYLLFLTLAASVMGFFVRRQQLATELLSDGSLAAGSKLHIVLLAMTVVMIFAFIGLLLPLKQDGGWQRYFTPSYAPNALLLLGAALLLLGNGLLLAHGTSSSTAAWTQSPAVSQALNRLTPPFGILAAVCLGVFAVLCLLQKKPSPLLYMLASVYLILRLIVRFQDWNVDPSIHDYAFRLLAAICCMLGCFQLAGFSFDRGHRRICLFWCLCAVVFCSISAADALNSARLDEMLIDLALLLIMAFGSLRLLFPNGPETPAPVAQPEETEAPEPPADPQ